MFNVPFRWNTNAILSNDFYFKNTFELVAHHRFMFKDKNVMHFVRVQISGHLPPNEKIFIACHHLYKVQYLPFFHECICIPKHMFNFHEIILFIVFCCSIGKERKKNKWSRTMNMNNIHYYTSVNVACSSTITVTINNLLGQLRENEREGEKTVPTTTNSSRLVSIHFS